MKDHEFLRVIEEVCLNLRLSRPCIVQVISYYNLFGESETHNFKPEIIIIACIYLASKINEELRKIRDIINITLIVTNFYKNRNKQLADKNPEKYSNKVLYVSLEHLKERVKTEEDEDSFLMEILPSYSLERYNIMRDTILKAEQHLLRILNFNLENKYEAYYQLLFLVLEKLKTTKVFNNLALGTYNDSFFLRELSNIKEDWRVLFSVYFAFQLKSNPDSKPTQFEKDIADKLATDEKFKQEFKKFTESMLSYYESLEDLE